MDTNKPNILLSSLDAERLEALLASLPADTPGKAALAAEVDRADVLEPRDMPPTVVTMNSTLRLRFLDSGEAFTLTLVYPKDADGSSGRLSILAPVGSAVLGLAEGDEIDWPRPGGGVLRVRIEEVTWQPERAGEYHR